MKTLKKSLCLILALVFVLSLCTVGAGAAFTDEAEIKYDDAVSIMADLGILSGMGDGSFAPDAPVTRAQAAKMIAYMILGKDNAEKMPATKSFDDVNAGDWYAKYVGYCARVGIINGMGDGTFAPDAPVTGTQLAKMILCAVGFGKNNEYVGEGWDFNAVADALTNGIYDNSEAADFGDKATREECALYVYNALINTDIQSYKDGEYTATKDTFGSKTWKLVNAIGIMTANKAAGATGAVIEIAGKAVSFDTDADLAMIGHAVRVLYNANATDSKTGAFNKVYAVTDVSTIVPAYTTVGTLKAAKTVNSIANYVVAADTTYTAPAAGTMTMVDLVMYNDEIIGYVMPESFSIAQVKSIDAKTGAYTLDDGTVTDKTWTLCGASKGDYIEVVKVGASTITRPTSKFENIKVTQITNPSMFAPAFSYNNGQFMQSAATNVASYLNEAAAKLTLGTSYTFYKDSKGNFFKVDVYKAAVTTNTVFFVQAFTIPGTATTDEYGVTIPAKNAYYAQCVTAEGEMVNYATAALATASRGPVSLTFDAKGNAVLGTATDAVSVAGIDASKAAVTKIPAQPYYLTATANVIELSQKDAKKGAAELSNLKVTTSTGSIKGDYSASAIYVVIPATTGTAKDIQTVWIDGAAKVTPIVTPVANSYIYVTNTAQVGTMLMADGKTVVGTYNVYVDGVATQIAMEKAPTTGFFTYTVKDSVYTLTAIDTKSVTAKVISLDGTATLLHNGEFSSSDKDLDAKSIAGMKVVDLRMPAPGVVAVNDVAGLEALTTTVTLTVLMSAKGAFVGVIYVA